MNDGLPGAVTAEYVRVLFVEDDPDDVALVRSILTQAVASVYTVVALPDVSAAATELANRSYDIVLLDLSPPPGHAVNGAEAMRHLGQDTPVVVLSGLDDEDVARVAVHQGAQDYLVKERLTADLLIRSIRYARERHRLLAERTRRLEHEFAIAALVQRSFLPAVVPAAANQDIGAYLHASGQIGGDFYDFIELARNRIGVAVGDASGKGIPGAILMAEAQGILRAEAEESVTLSELVRRINRALFREDRNHRFVTLFYGVLATDTGRFTFISAGHPRALLLQGASELSLTSTGPPLGLFANAVCEEQTVTLGCGDRLVIYSDGVTEAMSETGQFFDLDGVRKVIADHQDRPAAELARLICHAAERFERGNPDPGDDKTVVVVQTLAGSDTPPPISGDAASIA